MRVKFQRGTSAGGELRRLPVVLSLLVALFGAGIATSRAFFLLRSPEAALQAAALKAVERRDQLIEAELAWAATTADRVLASVASQGDSLFDHLIAPTGQERSLLLRRGEQVVAALGPQRFVPPALQDGVSLVATPFEHALVYRLTRDNLTADITLLLDAVPGVPRRGTSLAEEAEGSLKVRWEWGAMSMPQQVTSAAAAIGMVAERMRVQPPTRAQLDAREERIRGHLLLGSLLLVVMIWAVFPMSAPSRGPGVLGSLWLLVLVAGVPEPVGARSGYLVMVSLTLLMGLYRLRSPVSALGGWRWLPPILGLAAAPLLARLLAEFVVPLESSNRLSHWFLWQGSVALSLAAWLWILVPARGDGAEVRRRTHYPLVALIGLLLPALAGIEAWQPAHGWQAWFLPLCWLGLAPLLLPMAPVRRTVVLATSAAVLGLLATWGISLERRMAWATADLTRLVSPVDSVAAAALDDFVVTARRGHTTQLDPLFAAWSGSRLASLPIPTHLAISDGGGRWLGTVALDSIEVDWVDLDSLVAVAGPHPYRTELVRGGISYQVLVVPFAGDTVATITIGPRTELLSPTRFGDLVGWRSEDAPGYTLIGMAARSGIQEAPFDRRGRFLNATTLIPGGMGGQAVRAKIEMPAPQPFAVRAVLVVLVDVGAFLLLTWLLAWSLGLAAPRRSSWLRPSYRTMVAGALTAFFVVPAILFTFWSVVRVRQESGQRRDEEVQRKLRAPEAYRGVQLAESERPQDDALQNVAFSIDAELGIYRDHRLIAASTPPLVALGLLPMILPPGLMPATAIPGEPVVVSLPWLPSRLGLQSVGDQEKSYLAAVLPRAGGNAEAEQRDLLFLLLLTTLSGGIAAFWVADRVARTLAAPIERLTQSAMAFGRGEAMPAPPTPGEIPAEFVPVFDAMTEMVDDLRASEAERATAAAQTAKVVAWGEMARQVAHEIKNPLTPMRLGLQHLGRLQADERADFPEQVGATAARLLQEVDRLDRIARAFARYGAPPAENEPLVRLLIGPVLEEIADLFALAGGPPTLSVTVVDPVMVAVRREELIQVLLNLLENARHAGAVNVKIEMAGTELRVRDDGQGIGEGQLTRVFEPTFSTNTSGTGLGLPIVRRLVEGWGGTVGITSVVGSGTTVTISFHL